MQFVARFEMEPDDELDDICARMDITGVSKERIEVEFAKIFLKSRAFKWLLKINRLHDLFPEVAALIGIAQNSVWHPEGDVFEHTMQAIDAAVVVAQKYNTKREKLILCYAALCHDFGKPYATVLVDHMLTSHGHAEIGAYYAQFF